MRQKKKQNKTSCAFTAASLILPRSSTSAEESANSVEKIGTTVPPPPALVAYSSDAAEEDTNDSFSVNQADFAIKRGGEKFYDYYTAYKKIRELAKPLNGLPQSAPFPRGLSVQKIVINFTAQDVEYSVEIPEPQKAGDIAPLISFAIRDLVEKMNNELHVLSYLVSGMHNAVQAAFNARANAPPPELYDNTNTTQ